MLCNTKQTPTYQSICENIMFGIFSGRYQPGGKLPSIRTLASEQGVCVGTAQRAFLELEYLGLITTWRTNCKRISDDPILLLNAKNDYIDAQLRDLRGKLLLIGLKEGSIPHFISTRLRSIPIEEEELK